MGNVWRKCLAASLFGLLVFAVTASSASQAKAVDTIMGEYVGKFMPHKGTVAKADAKVIAMGKGRYRVVLTIEKPQRGAKPTRAEFDARLKGKALALAWKMGASEWTGSLTGGKLVAASKSPQGGRIELSRIVRHSPTEGLKPPPGAVVLLPYKPNTPPPLDEWRNKTWKPMPDGSMQVGRGNNLTVREFGDCRLHVEFMIPYEPNRRGQGRGNSGVYLQNRYEVQVLDSFGLRPGKGDCGAIYGIAPPRVNASLPPLQWQTYDIVFRAPRIGPKGQLLEPAKMTVEHNGIKIHENQPVGGPTRAAGARGHAPRGPLMLQDHGNPVRYRNIWLVELKEGEAGK